MMDLIKLTTLLDEAKCYEVIRQLRWPDGVVCLHCRDRGVVRNGHDDRERSRQRYLCKACKHRFDDLTGTVLAGHHQPVSTWILGSYFMGVNLSNRQIAPAACCMEKEEAKEAPFPTVDQATRTEFGRSSIGLRTWAAIAVARASS